MPTDEALASFSVRTATVRKIAQGIFDRAERRVVLELLMDAEKLAAKEMKMRNLKPT